METGVKQRDAGAMCPDLVFPGTRRTLGVGAAPGSLEVETAALEVVAETQVECDLAVVDVEAEVTVGAWPIGDDEGVMFVELPSSDMGEHGPRDGAQDVEKGREDVSVAEQVEHDAVLVHRVRRRDLDALFGAPGLEGSDLVPQLPYPGLGEWLESIESGCDARESLRGSRRASRTSKGSGQVALGLESEQLRVGVRVVLDRRRASAWDRWGRSRRLTRASEPGS